MWRSLLRLTRDVGLGEREGNKAREGPKNQQAEMCRRAHAALNVCVAQSQRRAPQRDRGGPEVVARPRVPRVLDGHLYLRWRGLVGNNQEGCKAKGVGGRF